MLCDLCEKYVDDQESLMFCEKLGKSSELVENLPLYKDFFSEDIKKQFVTSSILEEKFKLRNKSIDEMKKTSENS